MKDRAEIFIKKFSFSYRGFSHLVVVWDRQVSTRLTAQKSFMIAPEIFRIIFKGCFDFRQVSLVFSSYQDLDSLA